MRIAFNLPKLAVGYSRSLIVEKKSAFITTDLSFDPHLNNEHLDDFRNCGAELEVYFMKVNAILRFPLKR